ncbi:MAG: ABC transporter permease [Candidatus Hydrogenedentota bacterium]
MNTKSFNSNLISGLILLSFILFLSVIIYPLSKSDPFTQDLAHSLKSPSGDFLFGTDTLGRDLFSRTLYATKYSFVLGVIITFLTVVAGTLIALISGYFGGWFDEVLMRIMDCMMAFPFLLLAISIASLFEPGNFAVCFSLIIAGIPNVARLVRGSVIQIKCRDFITACKSAGGSNTRIIFLHILPNMLSTIIVVFSIRIGSVILSEASLSFLGLGIQPPVPTLGSLIEAGSAYIFEAPWWSIFPGIFLALIVFGWNILGDALRDILDPRLQ